MTFHEKLRAARRRKGMSQGDVAKAFGVSRAAISSWEKKGGTRPKSARLARLAAMLDLDLEGMLDDEAKPAESGLSAIRVVAYVGAGDRVSWIREAELGEPPPAIPLTAPKEICAMIVSGESQMPLLRPGDAVIFQAESLNPRELVGDFALVKTVAGHELVKTLEAAGDRYNLLSLNARAEKRVELLAAWRIIGVIRREWIERETGWKLGRAAP